ncbi:MAG: transposase [Magnetococcales bacterium]|nr:transposase [Magnetococcales bacterium]
MLGYHRKAFDFARPPPAGRGALQFFIQEDARTSWSRPVPTGKRGKPFLYADSLILSSLLVKSYYWLPYRMTATLFGDLLQHLQVPIPPPNHATLYYRHGKMGYALPVATPTGSPCMVVDGHGLRPLPEGRQESHLASSCHTVQFQVDAQRREMVMEYRLRLDSIEQSLLELTHKTAAARERLATCDTTLFPQEG